MRILRTAVLIVTIVILAPFVAIGVVMVGVLAFIGVAELFFAFGSFLNWMRL